MQKASRQPELESQSSSTPVFSLFAELESIPDPRVERTKLHPLINILVMTLTAVVAGADDWVSIAEFGEAKQAWFARYLDLSNGIPAHDTFGRIFRLLDPKQLQRCFLAWVQSVAHLTQGEIVAIDGKQLCGSQDECNGRGANHMVSAWACENRLVLGQVKVDDKSNELKAIPRLLELLDLHGCVVTVDAAGSFAEVATAVHAQGADWVLPLKENQPLLHQAVKAYFDGVADHTLPPTLQTPPPQFVRTFTAAHGRTETRSHWMTEDVGWLAATTGKPLWPGLRSIAMVRRQCQQGTNKPSDETTYYLTSLAGATQADVERFAAVVRSHWCVENQLHWVLDVAFNEDHNRSRCDHSAHNLALVHHLALNLLKQQTSRKIGIKNRRLRVGWDTDYLAKVIFSTQ